MNVFYWVDDRFGYAISAGADRDELMRVSLLVTEDERVESEERIWSPGRSQPLALSAG